MTVHNHGPEDGPGLSCPEYRVGGPYGRLRGACLDEAEDTREMAEWWAEARLAIQTNIDQLAARDVFGEPEPLHPLLDRSVPRPELVAKDEIPPVDPEWVKRPVTFVVEHPASNGWTADLGTMPEYPEGTKVWDRIQDWVEQRAVEDRMLEELTAILQARPASAPGLLIIHHPEVETSMVESSWIPSGTVIFHAPDQPDLMVQTDPNGPGVLYYRQRRG